MKKLLAVFVGLSTISLAFGQTKVQVKSDTVKIINGELVINNNTKTTQGYLYNTGDGITQFKPIEQFVDTVWAGHDTLYYKKGSLTEFILIPAGTLNDPGSNGIVSRTASNTLTARTLTGTTGNVVVTDGDGLNGNPTFDIGTNVATVSGSQTLTGKTISGSSNTLTNIGNSSLVNNSISLAIAATIGDPTWSSSSVALGGTATLNLPHIPKVVLVENTQHSYTGSTAETTIFTDTIAANSIGENGFFQIRTLASSPVNNVNSKVIRIKFNGTTVATIDLASSLSYRTIQEIYNRGSLSSQILPNGSSGNINKNYGSSSVAFSTLSINTGADIVVTVTAQNVSSSSDSVALEQLDIIGFY